MQTEVIAALTGCKLEDGWVIDAPGSRWGCHWSMPFLRLYSPARRRSSRIRQELDPIPDENLPEDEQLLDLEHRVAIFRYEQD